MRVRRVLCGLCLVALFAPVAHAQQWRTVDATRQRQHADSVLGVRIDYGAGAISVAATRPALLYDVHLRYDAGRFTPARHYDRAARELSIGLNGDDEAHHWGLPSGDDKRSATPSRGSSNALTVGLAPALPLDVQLDLGAVDAQIDLSTLWLDRLRLRTGASDVRLRFGTPNPRRMRSLEILGGATSITVVGLGNAHAELLRVRAGAANVDLDFSGAWAGNMRVELDAALGDATLRVPAAVGVSVTMSKLFADLHAAGFTKRDGVYYSDNWARAARKLTIEARAALGDVTVLRLDQ